MSFSQIQLLGNVGKEPELTVTPDGTPVCRFPIAINKKRKGKADETIWYNCQAWRALAETIERYVQKGSMLFVQGDFNARLYTGRDGKPGLSLDVTVEKFTFAGGSKPASSTGTSSDGDPFLPDELL